MTAKLPGVAMAALEPHGYMEVSEEVYSIKTNDCCIVYLQCHENPHHHSFDEVFLSIPNLMDGMRMATAAKRIECFNPTPVYKALLSSGQLCKLTH